MSTDKSQKNGRPQLTVIRGGLYATPRRRGGHCKTAAELHLMDVIRHAYSAARTPRGTRPSRAHQEIAEGRGARFATEGRDAIRAAEQGVPLEQVKEPAVRFLAWIETIPEFRKQPRDPAA